MTKKISYIGLNNMIGLTGKPNLTDIALSNINYLSSKLIEPYDVAQLILKSFSNVYENFNIDKQVGRCQIIVCGITCKSFNNDQIYEMFIIDTSVGQIINAEIKNYPDFTIQCLRNLVSSDKVNEIVCNELSNKNLENPNVIKTKFKSIVRKIHKKDTTVGKESDFYKL